MSYQILSRAACSFIWCLLVLVMSSANAQEAGPAASDVLGRWSGSLDYVRPDGRTQPVYFRVSLAEKNAQVEAAVSSYQIGVFVENKTAIVIDKTLSFEFLISGETARFDAAVDGDRMRGVVNWSQGARRVNLQRVFEGLDQDKLAAMAGLYEFKDEGELIIAPSRGGLNVYDNDTGDYRLYFPQSETSFFAGAAYLAPTPIETRLAFERSPDGNYTVVQKKSSGERVGTRSTRIVQEEISFENGDVELHGLLIRPNSAAQKVPGVVVVWGSGRQNRYGYQGLVYHRSVWLANKGFATVIFDKRGVGKSSGSYDDRTNELLAGDVIAAADFLASRPEVDAKKIGMVAHSQSGIYAPITIAESDHIKFAAIISTTIANSEIQEIVRTEQQLRADGWPDDDVSDAVATQILKFYYAKTRIGWDAYVSAFHRVSGKPWFETVIGSTIDQERSSWDFWKSINVYEPAEHWTNIYIPVFFLYGDRDAINPMEQNMSLLNEVYEGAGPEKFKLKLYQNAEHSLFVSTEGGVLEESQLTKLHPYLDDILSWMSDIGITSPLAD